MPAKTILLYLILLLAVGCKNKQEESAAQQIPSAQTQITQGALPDSSHQIHPDSVGLKEKPLPPIPIEDMTRVQLNEYKQLLAKNGFYDCCAEPSCRMCLFELDECPCEHNIKKKQPVCGECYDKWQTGRGKVKGIKPEEVKKM